MTQVDAQVSPGGQYLKFEYEPLDKSDTLQIPVVHTLWIPDGVTHIRGIVVHQHGCGEGACRGGQTSAYDLHWQALAAKWDCALLGPSYGQTEGQDCSLWCDPGNGSAEIFLRAIDDFADQSGHAELKDVPWCLWGHSGGGSWASLMQMMYPDRIVATWLQSGTAFARWEEGAVDPRVYTIPVMCCPGEAEKEHERFHRAYSGSVAMLEACRAKGAPIGLAPDPRTGHECGDSRYLAIPFFDACLAMRLSDVGGTQTLRLVDMETAWFAEPLRDVAVQAADFQGDVTQAVWLPNQRVAEAWMQFVKTGTVEDNSPPPAPQNVNVSKLSDETVQIAWDAVVDFESGIAGFVIQRDGQVIAQIPDEPVGKFGRPLFQGMTYHDTPDAPLPKTLYVDGSPEAQLDCVYEVIAVNGVGLKSEPVLAT